MSLLLVSIPSSDLHAGAYIFAGEGNGVDVITHPKGYTGSGGHITVTVGLHSGIPNVTATQLAQPIKNAIVRWNNLKPTTGNLVTGADNPLANSQYDYESVVLHELGHCIGLAHVNLATESGLSDPERNFTKSTDGSDNSYNVSPAARGADGTRGSHDDVRGDDVNLHWFNSTNNPFVLETPVDGTTHSRDLNDLPAGETFATNGDRTVSALAKYSVPNTEAVMQQGQYNDEEQHTLTADGVATIRLGMSGVDETLGTSDDYTFELQYVGVDDSADILVKHDNTGFAVCQTGGSFINSGHIRITSAVVNQGPGYNWYYNQEVAKDVPELTGPVDGSTLAGVDQTFSWTPYEKNVLQWQLYVGLAKGAKDLYNSGALDGSLGSVQVSGLPDNGSTLHARLWWKDLRGTWSSADYSFTATGSASDPAVTSPSNGATLSGATQTFSWGNNGTSVTEYWVYAGSSAGGSEYFDSGSMGTSTSVSVTGLPTDGSTVHVTLWWKAGGNWDSVKYSYTATAASDPAVTSPSNGATLSGATQTFSWGNNGTSVTEYWVYAGSSAGGSEYFDSGSMGTSTSVSVTGLPTDGSTVHVTLWWKVGGNWDSVKYSYTAATAASDPAVTSPSNGATLSGATQTFSWGNNGTSVTEYWVYAGSSAGGSEYFDSGSMGTSTSVSVTGLPTDGSTVHVTLWWKAGGNWDSVKYSYTATAASDPAVTSPSNGATLSGATQTFSWGNNGTSVTEYWVYAGSSAGGSEYFDSGSMGTSTSVSVTGLPTDGSTVHVTLWWKVGGNWDSVKYSYTAATAASDPAVTSPSNGATLSGATQTFSWGNNGTSVTEYWVYAGSSAGGSQYFDSGSLGTNTSVSVTGLPTDGSTVHVTLWWKAGGNWDSVRYSYTAITSLAVPAAPSITAISAGNGSLEVSFAPANSTDQIDSYTLTCVDQGARLSAESPESAARYSSDSVHQQSRVIGGITYRNALEWHNSDAFRQGGHRCGTDDYVLNRMSEATALLNETADCTILETSIKSAYNAVTPKTIVIPVHWHVIHKTDGTGQLSQQRIDAQMAVLNADFAGLTYKTKSGLETSIRFEVHGDIDYIANDDWFRVRSADDSVYKDSLNITPDRVLNIYSLVPLKDDFSEGTLGYARIPQTGTGDAQDGIVMLHSAVGGRENGYAPYDEGRTLVHEVGHYLGLLHTFQGGTCENEYASSRSDAVTNDLLKDTAPHNEPDYGISATQPCGVPSPIENFMNYSQDAAMFTFTAEQTNRMICSLANYRQNLYSVRNTSVSVSGANSPLTLTGLTNGNTYSCSVVATNTGGSSSPSAAQTAVPAAPAPAVTSPSNGATLSGATQTFSWGDNGTSVTEYWVYAGSSAGGSEYFDSGSMGTSTSVSVTGLPTDGSTVHVTLWWKVGGNWDSVKYSYTATAASDPAVTSPSNGATLSGATQTFSWGNNGTSVTEYWVYAGSSAGGSEYFDSGSMGTSTSVSVTGLPTDGSTVHVTLWWKAGGNWDSVKYSYTAATAASDPAVTSPSNGATLSGATQTFSWGNNGTSVTEYWVYAGSSAGGSEYFDSGSMGTSTSVSVTGLPTDGSTVHVTLWWKAGGNWDSVTYSYTAATP